MRLLHKQMKMVVDFTEAEIKEFITLDKAVKRLGPEEEQPFVLGLYIRDQLRECISVFSPLFWHEVIYGVSVD